MEEKEEKEEGAKHDPRSTTHLEQHILTDVVMGSHVWG